MNPILLFKQDLDHYSTDSLESLQQYFNLPAAKRDDLLWSLAIYQAQNNRQGTMNGGKHESESGGAADPGAARPRRRRDDCNFEEQQQLGATGNVKFCNGYAFKIYYGSNELSQLINNSSIEVSLNSSRLLRNAKKELNEILILDYLSRGPLPVAAPETQLYLLQGKEVQDEPKALENSLLSYIRDHYDPDDGEIGDWLSSVLDIIPIEQLWVDSNKKPRNNQYIIFSISKKLSGTLSHYLRQPHELSVQQSKDVIIAVMHKLNLLANAFNMCHNDAKFANILYQQLPQTEKQSLKFYCEDGNTYNITVNLDIRIYLTDFEWGYCNYPIQGYTVKPPEYISADEQNFTKRPLVPKIGSTHISEECVDCTYPYGTYYRGFEILERTTSVVPIDVFSHTTQVRGKDDKIYPRIFSIDTLMFVTECLKYRGFKQQDILVILNYYFGKFVRIATNELEPRWRGVTSYLKVSARALAEDMQTFSDRYGI